MSKEAHPDIARNLPRAPHIAPDFEPIYQLDTEDFTRIINNFATLVLESLALMQGIDARKAAELIAQKASSILADYDPDIADLVQSFLYEPGSIDDFDEDIEP